MNLSYEWMYFEEQITYMFIAKIGSKLLTAALQPAYIPPLAQQVVGASREDMFNILHTNVMTGAHKTRIAHRQSSAKQELFVLNYCCRVVIRMWLTSRLETKSETDCASAAKSWTCKAFKSIANRIYIRSAIME